MTPLPTLPNSVEGIVGEGPWRVQCQECGVIGEHRILLHAIRSHELLFHEWPDGANPRLCRDCRLARNCACHRCAEERGNR